MSSIVQVSAAGDFAEAFRLKRDGAAEFYAAQGRAVEACIARRHRATSLTYVRLAGGKPSDEMLECGVRYISLGLNWNATNLMDAARRVIQLQPSHVVLGFDSIEILKTCQDARIPILPVYANSFHFAPRPESIARTVARKVRHRWRSFKLGRLLGRLEWVANHNLPACRQLVGLGLSANSVIPYEFPETANPSQYSVKSAPNKTDLINLLYVGAINEPKGVFDVVRSLAFLKKAGRKVRLRIAGQGDVGKLRDVAESIGVSQEVLFVGLCPNKEILSMMHQAHIAIVPSRWDFMEGLPLTIFESLAARTPLICSDHPMFTGRLMHERDCLVFKATKATLLADQIVRLIDDPSLYAKLSRSTEHTWTRIRCDVSGDEVVDRWLSGTGADYEWLKTHSLGSGRYEGRDL
ncbi:MAG TPA: glycosyltransferase family 4 protein [Tepidisphaeraceae bacterium]|nr:glycosyltransferase family 4 protein [Tepidisphaeraceae bacterium]